MVESRLQAMLRERREKSDLQVLRERLGDVLTGQGLEASEVPGWVDEAVQGFWSVFAEPLAVLPDDAAPDALDSWIEDLLTQHGLAGTCYLASHIGLLPWAECRLSARWIPQVREAVEQPWIFLSPRLDTVIAIAEAEYRYEAHAAPRKKRGS